MIVGSGPAGAFVANELATNGKDVLVVESGGDEIDIDYNNFIDLKNSNITGKQDFGIVQQIGGASNLWAGGLARYDPVDLLFRKNFNFPGWPLDYDELEKFYKKVDNYLNIGQGSIDYDHIDFGQIEYRLMQILYQPTNTKHLIHHPNITVLSNTAVIKLFLSKDSKDLVKHVEVSDKKKGLRYKIFSNYFVIASGTISNIRIMLNSFSREEIGCYDSIGRYISTHPKAFTGYFTPFKKLDYNHPFFANKKLDNYWIRYQFGLSLDSLKSNDLLNHCIRFESTYIWRSVKIFNYLKKILGAMPFIYKKNTIISNFMIKTGVEIYRILEYANIRSKKSINNLIVRSFFDQRARYENRVKLSRKSSNDGLPLATIDWNFDETDWSNVDNFMSIFSKELLKHNIGTYNYIKPSNNDLTAIHSHFIGGTRIGSREDDSVVDKNLKVHGLKNLYISGPSVFPSYGYNNPFYTISAMSVRLGHHLLKKD